MAIVDRLSKGVILIGMKGLDAETAAHNLPQLFRSIWTSLLERQLQNLFSECTDDKS